MKSKQLIPPEDQFQFCRHCDVVGEKIFEIEKLCEVVVKDSNKFYSGCP